MITTINGTNQAASWPVRSLMASMRLLIRSKRAWSGVMWIGVIFTAFYRLPPTITTRVLQGKEKFNYKRRWLAYLQGQLRLGDQLQKATLLILADGCVLVGFVRVKHADRLATYAQGRNEKGIGLYHFIKFARQAL